MCVEIYRNNVCNNIIYNMYKLENLYIYVCGKDT